MKIVDLDRCHRRPCKNGGKCKYDGDDIKCDCLAGYRGALCEGKNCQKIRVARLFSNNSTLSYTPVSLSFSMQ